MTDERSAAGLVLNPAYIAALIGRTNASPFPSHLPMRVVAVGLGEARVELDIATCHLQPFGIVHGGVIATLVDTATFWAGYGSIPEDAGLVNVDLKLNYLAVAKSGRLIATGRAIKAGRTLGYTEATVVADNGELIAHGTSTLMVLPGKGSTSASPKFLS